MCYSLILYLKSTLCISSYNHVILDWCGRLMSDVKPELPQLAVELASLTRSEVTSMAVQLGVEYSLLRQIGQDCSEQSKHVLEAIDNWLNNDQEASWRKVVIALRTIKKTVLADSLEKKYCSPATTDCEFTPDQWNTSSSNRDTLE